AGRGQHRAGDAAARGGGRVPGQRAARRARGREGRCMLTVSALEVAYGAAPALWGVSLEVQRGELLSVVGPNGAGKSPLINTIAGLLRARAGRIELDGRDITRLPPHRFCAEGIALVPEGRRLFTTMSVRENLELGSLLPTAKAARTASLEHALALFPVLKEK